MYKNICVDKLKTIVGNKIFNETSVPYLIFSSDFGGGVTPILNSNGSVMIDKVKLQNKE